MYTAAVLAYFFFGQNNICYLAKLTLAAIACMWSVIEEGMGAERWSNNTDRAKPD